MEEEVVACGGVVVEGIRCIDACVSLVIWEVPRLSVAFASWRGASTIKLARVVNPLVSNSIGIIGIVRRRACVRGRTIETECGINPARRWSEGEICGVRHASRRKLWLSASARSTASRRGATSVTCVHVMRRRVRNTWAAGESSRCASAVGLRAAEVREFGQVLDSAFGRD